MPSTSALRVTASNGHATGTAIRHLWDLPPNYFMCASTVSAEGRFVSFIDWDEGNVAVHDLVTGENRLLTNNKWDDNLGHPEQTLVSPDGQHIAYSWFNRKGDQSHFDLRTIKLDGTACALYTKIPRFFPSPPMTGHSMERPFWYI